MSKCSNGWVLESDVENIVSAVYPKTSGSATRFTWYVGEYTDEHGPYGVRKEGVSSTARGAKSAVRNAIRLLRGNKPIGRWTCA